MQDKNPKTVLHIVQLVSSWLACRKAALAGCCLTYSCPHRLALQPGRSVSVNKHHSRFGGQGPAGAGSLFKKKKKEKQLRGWGTFVSLRNEMTVVEAFVVFATLHLYYFLFPQALNYCFRKCHRWETRQQEACAHTQRFCLLLLRPRPSLVIQIHPGKDDWKKKWNVQL